MRSLCCPCVCVCLCILPIVVRQRLGKNPLIVARQRLDRKFTAVTNTRATIEKLLDSSFSMWPVPYEGKQAISSSQNFLFARTISIRYSNALKLTHAHSDVRSI
jgi:hypothetical protein